MKFLPKLESKSNKRRPFIVENKKEKKVLIQPKQTSHHDVFFKEFYSKPEFALELFHLIFSKEELKAFDWSQLRPERDTLKEKRADLIFSVPLKEYNKTEVKIFILLEHKSSYGKELFTQLLHYQTHIHQRAIQEIGRPCPTLPVLFYHGKTPWKWKISYQEAFFGDFLTKIPTLFREDMINYRLRLLDIHASKVEKVFKDPEFKSRGALYLLKKIWSLEPNEASLEKVTAFFRPFSGMRNDLVLSMVDYLFRGIPGMTKETLQRAVEQGLNQKGGNYVGIREYIKEESLKEGLQKGRQEGLQKGLQKGRQSIALKMLQEGSDIVFISKVTGFSKEEIQKLTKGKNNLKDDK